MFFRKTIAVAVGIATAALLTPQVNAQEIQVNKTHNIVSSDKHSTKTTTHKKAPKAKKRPVGVAPLSLGSINFAPDKNQILSPAEFHMYATEALNACGIVGKEAQDTWRNMLISIAQRESTLKVNAVNNWDSNANGGIVADGSPSGSARGLMQLVPTAFANNHMNGTSSSIYAPVSNIAASVQYMKVRYGLGTDGSGVAAFQAAHGVGGSGY